jgi:hypothetical protein
LAAQRIPQLHDREVSKLIFVAMKKHLDPPRSQSELKQILFVPVAGGEKIKLK